MKSVCFTGHRTIKVTAELKTNLENVLTELIEKDGVTDFYAGGAIGFDMLCESEVIELKKNIRK